MLPQLFPCITAILQGCLGLDVAAVAISKSDEYIIHFCSGFFATDFNNLLSYSPLHNIKEGTAYPATLVTTADHDDRVVPAHSFKFIATLQEKHQGENPVLIRIETRSGHGSSSTTKMIEELADEYAFMLYNLGVIIK